MEAFHNLNMKNAQFRIPFTVAMLIWVIAFLVPYPALDEKEFVYLGYVVIPLGTLWVRAFVHNYRH